MRDFWEDNGFWVISIFILAALWALLYFNGAFEPPKPTYYTPGTTLIFRDETSKTTCIVQEDQSRDCKTIYLIDLLEKK